MDAPIIGSDIDNAQFGMGPPAPAADAAPPPTVQPPGPPTNGISPNYHRTVAGIESAGGTQYGNGGGMYQFIPSTAATLGYTQDQIRAMTPEQQTALNDRFTTQNTQALTKAGVPVNDVSAYVAHQQGVGGAKGLFTADPNARAADIVGAQNAQGNKPFFYAKDGTPLTVAQTLARFSAKVGQPYAPPGAAQPPQQEATVKGRLQQWISSYQVPQAASQQPAQQMSSEDREELEQRRQAEEQAPHQAQQVAPISGVVRQGGKVYFQRYGGLYDTAGKKVG